MGSTCKTMRQAFDAFLKGEVYLARGIIRQRGGNYKRCMQYSQTGTGFAYYMGFLQAYMQMNAVSMTRYMKLAYNWESRGMDICVKMPYPAASRYTDFNKCMYYGAEYMVADEKFGKEYMVMRKSNWDYLAKEMYKMIMYSGGVEEACNLNRNYQPKYVVTQKQVQQCAVDESWTLYWLKQSVLKACANDWYNVFMDMSKATAAAERVETTCKFQKKWVRRSRLSSDDSKMLVAAKDFKFDVTAPVEKLVTPQEMNQTEERKLVAY